jgi:hypothetical protein
MCDPATIGLIISGAKTALELQSAKNEADAEERRANEQNRIAKEDAINKMAQEDLRIRQEKLASLDKQAVVEKDRRKAEATAVVEAGEGGVSGVSVTRLFTDFLRQEGEYKSSVLNNLNMEIQQSIQNKKSISTGQSANSTFVQKFNPIPAFASAGLRFAGDYNDYRTKKLEKEQTNKKAGKYYG